MIYPMAHLGQMWEQIQSQVQTLVEEDVLRKFYIDAWISARRNVHTGNPDFLSLAKLFVLMRSTPDVFRANESV